LARRQKAVIEDSKGWRQRTLGAVLPCFALALAGMTLFNVFFQQPIGDGKSLVATGNLTTPNPSQRTLVLRYDETVEDVQRELLASGLFTGLVDGVDGPQTKVAVESYQRANQLDVTGTVSPSLLDHIRYTKKLAAAAKFTGSLTPATEIAPKKPVVPVPLAKPVAVAPIMDNGILELQKRLTRLGYDPGTRSGRLDEATRSAILIFEMDHDMAMDGKVSKVLLNALKLAEAKISASN
jgi:peptidoglycan hydrolase-like protein with peptidoglycan-binding domain